MTQRLAVRAKVLDLWRARVLRSFETFGELLRLSVRSFRHLVVDLAKRRFPWGEFLNQAWFVISVSAVPTLLVAVPFGVIISIQVGSLAVQVGATSFMGAANGLGAIKQGAPIVVALMLAGAVGSAICADLGARKIRDEIDAMEVMGISVIQRLVTPRLLATMVMAPFLCGIVAFTAVLAGYMFNLIAQAGTPGSFVASFAAFAQPIDLVLAMIKSVLFGAIISTVACHKGLSASGGPRGVANAVNVAVVLGIVLLFAVNVVITQVYTTIVPQEAF